MRDRESTVKPSRVVWGDWDKETVRLDWDDTPLGEVKLWSHRANKWFKLEGFIILLSSQKTYVVKNKRKILYQFKKGSYHVVFNRSVHWDSNVEIMNWVALESGNLNVQKWVRMQCIKKTSTLRVGCKGNTKPPRIVYHYGSQNQQIKKFLENRRFILDSIKKLSKHNNVS